VKKKAHIRLSVNLNKVALLRNARHTGVPNVLDFADIALEAGSAGITLHPRPDERHVRASDVTSIANRMRPQRPHKELNIEGYPDSKWLSLVSKVKPEQCTLVPDAATAFTSEKGWDLTAPQVRFLKGVIKKLRTFKTRIILFVDPGFSAFQTARELDVDGIEIYTGEYAKLFKLGKHRGEVRKIISTAKLAHEIGFDVHIGHDLNLKNIPPLLSEIAAYISEASIGHELTSDALKMGFAPIVRAYTKALNQAPSTSERGDFEKNPLLQFKKWFGDVAAETQPNAMILATATKKASPSARVVFLRNQDSRGFVFFTNYQSRKGRELSENPNGAVVFYWPTVGRQVRAVGTITRLSRKESVAYFATRPRDNQLSAWASQQSSVLENPNTLEEAMSTLRRKYDGGKIPCPPHWGGFRLTPQECEFWQQGETGRLHTRVRYTKKGSSWKCDWLAP
jgi:pyridoxine 5-phosphate synthase